MSANWGRVCSSLQIARGVRDVCCEGHGGILVTYHAMQTLPFLQKLKEFPGLEKFKSERGGYEFEEDCDAAVIYFCLGREKTQEIRKIADENMQRVWDGIIRTMITYNPNAYTHLSGIGVSIFESYRLLEDHMANCGHEIYKYCGSLRSDDYAIPEGKRVVAGYNPKNHQVTCYFMMDEQHYQSLRKNLSLPIDLSVSTVVEKPKRLEIAA